MRQHRHYQWIQRLRGLYQCCWIPLLVGIVATIAVLGVWQQLLGQERLHIQQLVQQQADVIKLELSHELSARMATLKRMAKRWEVEERTAKPVWEISATSNIEDFPGFQAIEWINPSFQVQWIVPLQGNEEAQNLDMTQDPRRYITLRVARDLRQPLLSRTISLAQGGKGFLACVPLFLDNNARFAEGDRFDGFIVGVFRYQTLFDSILRVSPRYQVQVHDGTEQIYSRGEESDVSSSSLSTTVIVQAHSADWRVEVKPTSRLISEERSLLPILVLWGGLAGTWTLALAVYLGQRSERHVRRARKINRQFQGEIRYREQVEANLRASEERWQLALRGNNDGIWDWNVKTNEVFFSSRWKEMLGFADHEITNHLDEWARRVHPDDLDWVTQVIQDHFARKTPFYISEHRVQCKDGSYKWILDRGQALWDEAGNVIRMTGSHTDITERKQAEAMLRRYERIVSASSDCVSLVDRNYVYQVVNQSYLTWNQKTCHDIVGHSISDLLGQEFFETLARPSLDRCLAENSQQIVESWLTYPDGQRRFTRATYDPYVEEDGTVSGVVINVHDLTELKQAELENQSLRDRMQFLLATSPVVLYSCKPEGHFACTFISENVTSILGYTPTDFLADSDFWVRHLHADDTPRIFADLVRLFEQDHHIHEYRFQHKEGHYCWIQDELRLVRNEKGEPAEIVGCCSIIDDRKQAEIALENSQARFAGILEIASDAIISVNNEQQITLFNKGAEHIFGYRAEEVLGQPLSLLLPERFAHIHRQHVTSYAQTGGTREMAEQGAIFGRRKDGTEFPAEASISKLSLNGETIFTTFLRDITQRQQAEAAMARLAAIVESSEDAIIGKSLEGIITSWNAGAEKIFGYTAEEMVGQPVTRLIPEGYLDEENQILKKFWQGERIAHYDTKRRRKDGTFVDLSIKVSLVKDAQGNIIGASKIARDISERVRLEAERKEAEEKLRRSEAALAEAQRMAHLGNWELDVETRQITWSDELFRMFGFDPNDPEPAYAEHFNYIHPDDRVRLQQSLELAMSEGTPYEIELRIFRPDGTIGYMEARGAAKYNNQGHIEKLFGTALDITGRKQAEAALAVSQQRFQNLVENSPDIIERFDLQLRHLYVSPALTRITGLSPDVFLGKTCREVSTDEVMVNTWEAAAATLLKTGQKQVIEFETATLEGIRSFEMVIAPEFSDQETLESILCISRDITERKQAEAALRQGEEKFRMAIDFTYNWEYWQAPDGTFVYISPSCERITGYPPTEFIENPELLYTIIHPDDRSLFGHHYCSDTLGAELADYRIITRSGDVRWISHICQPVFDRDRQYLGLRASNRDISDRKQAELDLQESEDQFQAFMQNAPLLAWMTDAEGIVLYANTAFSETIGSTPAMVIGQSIEALFPQEFAQDYLRNNQLVIETETVIETIEVALMPDGSQREYLVRKFPIHRQAQTIWVGGVAFDITNQRQAERAVQQSEERFRQIAETIQDVFFVNAPDLSQVDYISPAYEMIWGQSCESLYQQPNTWTSMIHPGDRARVETALHLQLAGEPFHEEYRILRPDGSIRWIFSRAFPTFNEAGELANFIGLASDITERKQAELALQESEERFRVLVTHAPVGIFQTDVQGNCLYVNPRWMEMTGLSSEAALQDGWMQSLHPNDRETIFQEWVQATEAGRPFHLEYRFKKPDGTVTWVSGQAIAVRDETGAITQYFGTVMDITARKQAEATKQALIESIPDFLLRMRRDGLQLEILNCGAIQLIQPGVGEISGQYVTKIMPPDIAQERIELTQKALESGTVQTHEYRFELDGVAFYEEARIAPLNADEVLVVVRDITERHRAEQALRDSEEKFRQLAENIHQVFFILSAEGDALYISPAYEHIWQRSCESFYTDPRSWLESVHPEDLPQVAAALNHQILLKEPFDETFRIIRQDGEIRWIASQSFPLKDAAENVVRFTGIAEDITPQKQAEEALRQSEATKQAIIEAIPDLLIRMCADGRYIDFISDSRFNIVNLAHVRHNANVHNILPSELAQLRLHHTRQALQLNKTQVYEQEICVEGKQSYEEVRIVPLQHEEVLVMVRDITDRKQAETELKHQKEMLQTIVNHIPVMIALFNAEGRIEFVNLEFEQVLGWTMDDWQQRDVLLECYPDPVDYRVVVEHMLAVNGNWKDFTTLTKTGQQIETSWTNVPLSNGSNLGIGQDITDRKRKEIALRHAMEAAQAANLAKSMFLANMSHELRTPLNVILGFVQVMAHDPSLTPNQRNDLQTIRRSGDHLLSLINDVLDLSKIEAGHCTVEEAGFDLISLLHTLRTMMTERAKAKSLQLEFDIAPEVPQFVITDEQKLRQILLNLLSNAIKFTKVGQVTLRVVSYAVEQGRPLIHLRFEISDTGIGIAPEELDGIFDAFVQAEAGRKSTTGTGLGLTISHKLLELMGGHMTVTSIPGQGSTFSFTLPVTPTSGVDGQPGQQNRTVIGLAPGQPHRRILVVDDQAENRQLMVRLLTQLGLEVREAVNGQAAIQIWHDWQPDLTWMDIRMPGMDGYEATRWIREYEKSKRHSDGEESSSNPPQLSPTQSIIIALTAQASQSDRTLALAAGCNDYISKPFREDTLFLKMAEYLGLEYLYAESNSDSSSSLSNRTHDQGSDVPDLTPLTLPDLDTLPEPWLRALEEAAICGSDRAIADLVKQLPPELSQFAAYLMDLANQYQFEQILTLIQSDSAT